MLFFYYELLLLLTLLQEIKNPLLYFAYARKDVAKTSNKESCKKHLNNTVIYEI